jgi:hypothetical protein
MRRVTNYVFDDPAERDTYGPFGTGVWNGDRCVLLSDFSQWVWDTAKGAWRPDGATSMSDATLIFQTAVDGTLPTIPAVIDLPFGNPTLLSDAGPPNPLDPQSTILAPRRIRPRRVAVTLFTDPGVTGPLGAATIDLTVDFDSNPPPYAGFTLVESVGPEATPVGSNFDASFFDFAEASTAEAGELLVIKLRGLDNAVLPASPGAETLMIAVLATVEWGLEANP